MKDRIFKNWNFIRIFRLVLGAWVTYFSLGTSEYILLIVGIWLLIQAILDLSCCGIAGCSSAKKSTQKQVYLGEIKKYNPNNNQ